MFSFFFPVALLLSDEAVSSTLSLPLVLLLSFVSVTEFEEEEAIPTGVISVPASGAFEVKESIKL